jgi:hypothetical protein
MAIFRKIHTSFWSDSFVSELENDYKLFYIYLMTNERTRQCGVYEITKKQIAFDLGYSIDKVSKLLTYFINRSKIKYNEKTNEIALGNWLKYNSSTSPKVQSCINKEFSLVKDTLLIEYVKSMDTQSQEEQEEEQEEEQIIEGVFSFNEFWELYPNKTAKAKCKPKFDKLTNSEKEQIKNTINKFLSYKPFPNYNHPNPETYLNQKRWEDVIPESVQQKGYDGYRPDQTPKVF